MSRRLRDDPEYNQSRYLAECHPPSVYFVQAGSEGPIKIGHTNCISRRLGNMQQGNHEKLKLLTKVEAPRDLETQLHERFEPYRIAGEWFAPAAPITNYIADAIEGIA